MVLQLHQHHMDGEAVGLGRYDSQRYDRHSAANDQLGNRRRCLSASPIPKVKNPRRHRREVHYTTEQFDEIIAASKGPLVDLLKFLWRRTGCRPKEARTIEARHVQEDLILFPADESKGEV